jgi:hypothetical protein
MADSPTCAVCEQPIRLDDPVYFWADRQSMEHLSCHARSLDISAGVDASADPVYGPMS